MGDRTTSDFDARPGSDPRGAITPDTRVRLTLGRVLALLAGLVAVTGTLGWRYVEASFVPRPAFDAHVLEAKTTETSTAGDVKYIRASIDGLVREVKDVSAAQARMEGAMQEQRRRGR